MTWFTEDPLPLLYLGLIVLAMLLVVFFRTGRAVALLAMLVMATFVGGAFLIDSLVVTEKERVENVIFATAQAIKDGDTEQALSYISPENKALRSNVSRVIKSFIITEVKVTDGPETVINMLTAVPTARSVFVARGKGGVEGFQGVQIYKIEVKLRRIDGQWLITEGAHTMPDGLPGS